MSDSILFSATAADSLNEAAKKIAPHLFLFCHYNPDPVLPFSSDGKYLLGVLNLYKLTTDASLAKGVRDMARRYDHELSKKIGDIIHKAEFLRAALAHNYSIDDGSNHSLWLYKCWVEATTNQSKLSTCSSYDQALAAVEEIGKDLIICLENFLNQAVQDSDRSMLISDWEDKIVNFYFSGEKGKNIIKQQLREYIHVQMENKGVEKSQINNLYRGNRQIALWVEKFYLDEFDSKLRHLEKVKEMGISSTTLIKIDEQYKTVSANKAVKQREIATAKHKNVEQLEIYDYLDYYQHEARDRMEKALQNSGQIDTLLPVGFFANMIVDDMKKVSSPI